MTTETSTGVQPALLFMPDISGFTEFVTNTEITHAQSIIKEVLEILIASNEISLEVGEIEGDAVFFYRLGKAPALSQLLQQVQTMFTRFHQHLRLYEQQRICPCEACLSASQLKLKIVVHYGEVAGYSVRSHHKLFGKDIIILHRLLKNSLQSKEYALLTAPLFEGMAAPENLPDWFSPVEAKEQYDVGEISFRVSDLQKLKEQLPDLPPVPFSASSRAKTVFTLTRQMDAPAEKVFGAIFDLSLRTKWMEGVQKVELITRGLINHIGTRHRCITGRNRQKIMITESAQIGEGKGELTEMDRKGMTGCRYRVESAGHAESRLTIDLLLADRWLLRLIFFLFFRGKIKKQMSRSLENLNEFCRPSFVRSQMTASNLN